MNQPLVSIVMPNYNDARFLRESVDALLGQSYPFLEIIIVDDASTDESPALLAAYERRDSRVRVLLNPGNRGTVLSATRGQAEARGEYLYFASSDDKVLPGFFEKSVKLLEEFPKAGLCWTDPSHFFASGGPVYSRHTGITAGPAYLSPEDLVRDYQEGRLSAPLHAAPALLRRSTYEAAGGFLGELRWYCDFFVTLVMAFRTGICYLPEALTSTRVQQQSYSRSGSVQKAAQEQVLTRILDLLLSPAYKDVAPLVNRSGVLAYFGWPMFQLAQRHPKYRPLLDRRFLLRGLFFSVKHEVRRVASPPIQRFYFLAREIIRSRVSESTPPIVDGHP